MTTDNKNAARGVAINPADPEDFDAPSKRTRRNLGRLKNNPDPTERHFMMDGEPAIAVGLGGKLGVGKEMILDADEWNWLAPLLGKAWGVVRGGRCLADGSRRFFV